MLIAFRTRHIIVSHTMFFVLPISSFLPNFFPFINFPPASSAVTMDRYASLLFLELIKMIDKITVLRTLNFAKILCNFPRLRTSEFDLERKESMSDQSRSFDEDTFISDKIRTELRRN